VAAWALQNLIVEAQQRLQKFRDRLGCALQGFGHIWLERNRRILSYTLNESLDCIHWERSFQMSVPDRFVEFLCLWIIGAKADVLLQKDFQLRREWCGKLIHVGGEHFPHDAGLRIRQQEISFCRLLGTVFYIII